MPVDLLDRILEAARIGETTDWEFKSARGGFPGSFWETYNRRRWSRYRLSGGVHSVPSLFDNSDSSHKNGNSIRLAGNSMHMGGDSIHLEGNSLHTGRDSLHNSGDSLHQEGYSLHNDWKELEAIAQTVSLRKPAKRPQMRETIRSLCRQRYLTAEQLARLVARNVDGLRNRYLTPMVAENLLALRFPESANRPDQAYTATEDLP